MGAYDHLIYNLQASDSKLIATIQNVTLVLNTATSGEKIQQTDLIPF